MGHEHGFLAVTFALTAASCGAVEYGGGSSNTGGADGGGADAAGGSGTSVGHIVYTSNSHLYRIAARSGSAPEDLTAVLPGGAGAWGDLSPDGQWLVYAGDHGCSDYTECLMVVRTSDWSTAVEVKPGGEIVHPVGRAAIASGGGLVVYAVPGTTHAVDLFATTRSGDTWSAPISLTDGSDRAFNQLPRFSGDATQLVLDCGSDVYSQTGTTICEANRDGSGFRSLLDPWPAAGTPNERHHAGLAPDGSLVFEADADGERIWRLPPATAIPTVIGDYNDDNTPCVLPDGRVASLYLGRAGGVGAHELKVMNLDGTDPLMLVTFASGDGITDIGLGCGL